jgi:uncharacterized protein
LYPCERLIGEDRQDNPMRLKGDALHGHDFTALEPAEPRTHPACSACPIDAICTTTCRCSNYVRTGNAARPDRLLCMLNEYCTTAVLRLMRPTLNEPALETMEVLT